MTERTLDVICFGQHAGALTDAADGLAFDYAPAWVRAGRPPLSQSLPVSGRFGSEQVAAYFGGLLPEGPPRQLLARRLGISVGNDFGLLERLAGDTAGAVSLIPPGDSIPQEPGAGRIEWLAEPQLAGLIEELPSRPMHIDGQGEYRLSLAGVQDKLPVVVDELGRVGLTDGRTPSTHILKAPIAGLGETIANEALCLDIGRRLGITTVDARPRRVGATECLLVRRYDRRESAEGTRRLHQEDFCQALGVSSARKYEAEGGPGLAACFSLLRRAVAIPARETPRLLDCLALSFLVGNNDAHGKNYSLVYAPESDRAALAPAYDIISTVAYRHTRPMSRKMAMSIGGEYRPDYLRARHLAALMTAVGVGPAASRRRLRALAESAPAAAAAARVALAQNGWEGEVLRRIEEIVEQRSGWLYAIAA